MSFLYSRTTILLSSLIVCSFLLFFQLQQQKKISQLDGELKEIHSALKDIDQKLYSLSLSQEVQDILDHPGEAPVDHKSILAKSLKNLSSRNLIKSYRAARVVKRFGAKAIPGLLDLIENGNSHARKASLLILGEMEESSTLPKLRKFAKESNDKMVRAGSIGILAKMRDKESTDTIYQALKDPEREVRHAAVLGVRRLVITKALPDLIRIYEDEKTFFSSEIEKTILVLANKDNESLLKEIQSLPSQSRFHCLQILSKDTSGNVVGILKNLLSDSDPRVALGSARLLSKTGDSDAINLAKKVFESSQNPQLQSLAKEIIDSIKVD